MAMLGIVGLLPQRSALNMIVHFGNGIRKDMAGTTTSESLFGEKKTEKAETRHHDSLSPSSFPAMDKCPCFKSHSDSSGEALQRGNLLHDQLHEILTAHEV